MECFAGVAAVGAKSLFEYNRGNFMYDREQRLKKEFQLQKFRVAQASLWRDDVRDLISLTEYKMHIYLLVNVLLLGFTIVLWCEGRLPSDTPDWLMMGSAVSITGAFMFLLLSMWLAMHAAVAAQSYEARLLTQLVRLPIPTWTEIEACRTYGSDFERIGPRQLLRVPFLAGSQEGLVRQTPQQLGAAAAAGGALAAAAPAAEESEGPLRGGGQASCGAGVAAAAAAAPPGAAAALAVDPWGYERSGSDIYELGCQHGSQVAKLRHIKLARQAMVYWQSYDAFSRISLSIGINQLLLALSYYILGYILVEVGCRTAATYGVLLLCALAEAMAKLDMSLSMWQLRQIQFLLAFGPIMSCVAAYRWSTRSFEAYWFAEALIILSFFSHGLLVALMIRFCCIKPHDNGLMLPTAFRGVLYLDVFGWLRTSPTQAVPGPLRSPGAEAAAPRSDLSGQALVGEDLFMLPPRRRSEYLGQRPALMTIINAAGRPLPCCPQDLTPEVAQDFRDMPGAPDPSGSSCTEFYDAEFWLTGDTQEEEGEQELGERDLAPIVTGHEKEVPRILPWRVFCFFAVVLSVAWMLAALYHILGASKAWDFDIPMTWERESPEELAGEEAPRPPEQLSLNRVVSPESLSLAVLYQVMVPGQQPQPEHIPLTWPHQNVKPVGLACDAQGQHFVVTDGLLVYSAELSSGDGPRRAQQGPELAGAGAVAAAQRLRADKAQHRHEAASQNLEFSEVQCAAVAGEGLQDVAVACAAGGEGGCEALVLHRHGRRIAACHLGEVGRPSESRQNDTTVLVVSDKWLNRMRDRRSSASNAGDADDEHSPHTRAEKAVAIATDSTCSSVAQGCALLATTYGRVVRLQQHPGSQEVLPTEVLREAGTGRGQSTVQWEPGSLRVLQNVHQRLGRLEGSARDRQSLLVLGSSSDGVRLRLPASKAAVAFCAGGGFLHFLLQGPSPGMWRIPLPHDL